MASANLQYKVWLARIVAQYEDATVRAETLLAKARASVANSRSIHTRAMASDNAKLKARAAKSLRNAEALQQKATADLLAARSALAVLRGGPPATVPGTPMAFVSLGQDARYTPGSRAEPAALAFYGLNPGDRFETGPAGRARLHLLENEMETDVQLGAGSQLVTQRDENDEPTTRLVLQQGAARVTDSARTPEARAAADKRKSALDGFFSCLEKDEAGYFKCAYGYLKVQFNKNRFEIRTPAVVFAVRGTEYLIEHDEVVGATTLKVLEGEVAMLSDRHGRALLVGAGQGARADATGLRLLETGVDAATERARWEE